MMKSIIHIAAAVFLCSAALFPQELQIREKVTFNFSSIPADQAFSLIEKDSGLVIAVSPELKDLLSRRVSLNAERISVLRAVLIICSQIEATASRTGKVINVVPVAKTENNTSGGTVVTVNGFPITDKDIARRVLRYFPKTPPPPDQALEIKKQLAFQLIVEHLQNTFIEKNLSKVEVSDERIRETLKKHKEYAATAKDSAGNIMFESPEAYYSHFGCSDEKEFISRILIPAIRYHMFFEFQIRDDDLKQFFKRYSNTLGFTRQVRARHILFKSDGTPGSDAAAKQKAEKVLEEIKNGADFGKKAAELSEAPTKNREGDLGYFTRGTMLEPLDNAAFSLEKGEISKPIKTKLGWHILQVTGSKEARSFEDVKDKVKEIYIERLKKNHSSRMVQKADIRILDDIYSDILRPKGQTP